MRARHARTGDDSMANEKTLTISTDVPDVASVQNLYLYITIQGAADGASDFTVWRLPPDQNGPLPGGRAAIAIATQRFDERRSGRRRFAMCPGIQSWGGVVIIVSLILLLVFCVAFGFLYYNATKVGVGPTPMH